MNFQREVNLTKVAIADWQLTFFKPGPDNIEGVQSGRLSVQITKSDGTIENRSFDLLERLNDDAAGLVHLANLISLRDYIQTRLDNEVLPL